MSFFSWFSGRSRPALRAGNVQALRAASREKRSSAAPAYPMEGDGRQKIEHKHERHARREQLYLTIREAMTRAGVLSASYKFKVLSLDQWGKEFLVMIDLTHVAGDLLHLPVEMEALIVHSAKVRDDIMVQAVYWRLNEVAAPGRMAPPTAAFPRSALFAKSEALPHEPIQAEEVAAFQQALLTASTHGSSVLPEKNVKSGSGPRFRAQPEDFEDTEVSESTSYPALSNTQYGELH